MSACPVGHLHRLLHEDAAGHKEENVPHPPSPQTIPPVLLRRTELTARPGRSTPLSWPALHQLYAPGESLAERFRSTVQQVGREAHEILGRWNAGRGLSGLPHRRVPDFTCPGEALLDVPLLEGEHPAWPLLALSCPPVLAPGDTLTALRAMTALRVPRGPLPLRERLAMNLPDPELEAALRILDPDVPRDFALLLALGLRERTRVTAFRAGQAHSATPLRSREAQDLWTRALPLEREFGDLAALRSELLRLEPDEWPLAVAWHALGPLGAGLPTPTGEAAAWTARHILGWRRGGVAVPRPSMEAVGRWLDRLLPGTGSEARRTAIEALSAGRSADENRWHSGTLRGAPGELALWRAGHGQRELLALHVPQTCRQDAGWPLQGARGLEEPPEGASLAAAWTWRV